MRLVIVGGGPAGLAAARAYREAGGEGAVDAGRPPSRTRPYQRPPLTKEFLRGEREPDELPLEDEAWFAEHDVDVRSAAAAARARPRARGPCAPADGRELAYDALRARHRLRAAAPARPGAEDPAVLTLRTLDDARRCARGRRAGRAAVVVGSGFIGCEAAASLAHARRCGDARRPRGRCRRRRAWARPRAAHRGLARASWASTLRLGAPSSSAVGAGRVRARRRPRASRPTPSCCSATGVAPACGARRARPGSRSTTARSRSTRAMRTSATRRPRRGRRRARRARGGRPAACTSSTGATRSTRARSPGASLAGGDARLAHRPGLLVDDRRPHAQVRRRGATASTTPRRRGHDGRRLHRAVRRRAARTRRRAGPRARRGLRARRASWSRRGRRCRDASPTGAGPARVRRRPAPATRRSSSAPAWTRWPPSAASRPTLRGAARPRRLHGRHRGRARRRGGRAPGSAARPARGRAAGVGAARRLGHGPRLRAPARLGRPEALIATTDADTRGRAGWLAAPAGGRRRRRARDRRARSCSPAAEDERSRRRRGAPPRRAARRALARPRAAAPSTRTSAAPRSRSPPTPTGASAASSRGRRSRTRRSSARSSARGVPITRAAAVRVRTSARAGGRAFRGLARDLALERWRARRTARPARWVPRGWPSGAPPPSASSCPRGTARGPSAASWTRSPAPRRRRRRRGPRGGRRLRRRHRGRGPSGAAREVVQEAELLPGFGPAAARATRCGAPLVPPPATSSPSSTRTRADSDARLLAGLLEPLFDRRGASRWSRAPSGGPCAPEAWSSRGGRPRHRAHGAPAAEPPPPRAGRLRAAAGRRGRRPPRTARAPGVPGRLRRRDRDADRRRWSSRASTRSPRPTWARARTATSPCATSRSWRTRSSSPPPVACSAPRPPTRSPRARTSFPADRSRTSAKSRSKSVRRWPTCVPRRPARPSRADAGPQARRGAPGARDAR